MNWENDLQNMMDIFGIEKPLDNYLNHSQLERPPSNYIIQY